MNEKSGAANPQVDAYLDGLRAALADLPAPELEEILDDARAHLAELTTEIGPDADHGAIEARIGTPADYAAELRAAAGYPPTSEPAPTPSRARGAAALTLLVLATALTGLAGLSRLSTTPPVVLLVLLLLVVPGLLLVAAGGPTVPAVASLPLVAGLRDGLPAPGTPTGRLVGFLASLQPAWWVVRAIGAALLVSRAVFGSGGAVALLLAVVAVPISVWVGVRTRADRRWLWVAAPLNALAAAVVLHAAVTLDGGSGPVAANYPYTPPGLSQDGRQITDIRPFDAAGKPVDGVYLFDQDGAPLDTWSVGECAGDPSTARPPYPRGTHEVDPQTGTCRLVPPPPLAVAVPTSAAPTSAAPTSAAAPSTPQGATTSAGPTTAPR